MSRVYIELGCGTPNQQKGGYKTIDIRDDIGADIVHDLEKGIPLENNSVDKFYSSHCLEHLTDFGFIMREMWRVLKPGGTIEIIVPHFLMYGCHWEHKTHFNYYLFQDVEKFGFKMINHKIDFMVKDMRFIRPLGRLVEWFANNYMHYYCRYLKMFFPPIQLYCLAEKVDSK